MTTIRPIIRATRIRITAITMIISTSVKPPRRVIRSPKTLGPAALPLPTSGALLTPIVHAPGRGRHARRVGAAGGPEIESRLVPDGRLSRGRRRRRPAADHDVVAVVDDVRRGVRLGPVHRIDDIAARQLVRLELEKLLVARALLLQVVGELLGTVALPRRIDPVGLFVLVRPQLQLADQMLRRRRPA